MSQLGLVEGVTFEYDYRRFVIYCSIIFLCVCVSVLPAIVSRVDSSSIAVLQKDKAAENSLMALCITLLHLSFTLSFFMLHKGG